MQITDVKVHTVEMSASWLSDGLIANPMSVYPRFKEKRQSWFGPMTAAIVEIQSDAGLRGLGTVGGGKGKLAPLIVEEQFKNLLVGQDPFRIELLWEQMFRASQFYGRKGAVIEVISGIDIALWDLVAKALGQPVYNLIGGKTKDPIPVYLTGALTEVELARGFRHVKIPVIYGPADGKEGLRKNVELVFVKGTQKISGLAEREVLDGSVEVGKIHVHAHGRPMSSGCRLDGIRCARLGIGPDIEKPGEERKPRRDAVVKRKLDRLAPLPGRVVARTYKSRNPPHGVIETLHQRGIKVRVAGRKPARPAVLEDIFEKDRAQAPMIDRNVVREFWPQDAFEECLPRELKHQRRT